MTRKKRRIIFPVLFLRILIIFLIASFFSFYFILSSTSWDGRSRFTVVMQNESKDRSDERLSLISIEPHSNSGRYFYISDEFMFDIPYGYKKYPAYSVYKLGQLDNKREGGKLLKGSIETTMGIKNDRFAVFSGNGILDLPDSEEKFKTFKKEYFNLYRVMPFFRILLNESTSDMNILEKWRFFTAIRKMKTADFEFVDLSKSSAAFKESLPDNTEVFTLDIENFDFIYSGKFQNVNVRREQYTLEVQNATGVEKIAGQFARILNHLGAYVILKTTANSESDKKCVVAYFNGQSRNSTIAHILENDYNCEEVQDDDATAKRSDIRVIIGKEFLK